MSLIPESQALAINAPSQPWLGPSMYMFPPFLLCTKGTPDTNVWINLEFYLTAEICCLNQGTSRTGSHTICRHRSSHAALPNRDFQKRSLGLQLLLEESQQTACTTTGGIALLSRPQNKELIPLVPHADAQKAPFLYSILDTHGISPQTVKGYTSCLASVLSRTGRAAMVQDRIIIIRHDIFYGTTKPRLMPVLPKFDLRIVLEARVNLRMNRATGGLSVTPYVR